MDLSALDMVDLNFKFVFHVALGRRISAVGKPAVKSAFFVTSPATAHYAKLHSMLTDYSPLDSPSLRITLSRRNGLTFPPRP